MSESLLISACPEHPNLQNCSWPMWPFWKGRALETETNRTYTLCWIRIYFDPNMRIFGHIWYIWPKLESEMRIIQMFPNEQHPNEQLKPRYFGTYWLQVLFRCFLSLVPNCLCTLHLHCFWSDWPTIWLEPNQNQNLLAKIKFPGWVKYARQVLGMAFASE